MALRLETIKPASYNKLKVLNTIFNDKIMTYKNIYMNLNLTHTLKEGFYNVKTIWCTFSFWTTEYLNRFFTFLPTGGRESLCRRRNRVFCMADGDGLHHLFRKRGSETVVMGFDWIQCRGAHEWNNRPPG